MPTNKGHTTLKSKRRSANPMGDYDSLPVELRQWVAGAALPWRAKSVQKAYDKALAKTGDRIMALRELDALQKHLIARDAAKVWGQSHPAASRR